MFDRILSAFVGGFAAAALVFSVQAKETTLTVPAATASGANYSYDVQTESFWSNGLPEAGDTVTLARDSKTAYITNSLPLYLQNLVLSATDFYYKSVCPIVFNAPEGEQSVISGNNFGLKIIAPAEFSAPVAWTSGGSANQQVTLHGPSVFRAPVEVSGQLLCHTDSNKSMGEPASISMDVLTGYMTGDQYGAVGVNNSTFSVTNTAAFGGYIQLKNATLVHGGADTVVNDPTVTATLVTDGLVAQFDASDEASVTFTNGNRISEWRDKIAGLKAVPAIADHYPWWRERDLGAKPTVDLGPAYLGTDQISWSNRVGPLKFETPITGVKTVFYVLDSSTGGGWLLPAVDADHRNLHRAGDGNAITDPWISSTANSPSYEGTSMRVNGQAIADMKVSHPGGTYELITLSSSREDGFVNALAGLGFDCLTKANLEHNRSGHQRIAEALIYNRALSETEVKQVEKYLHEKWLAGRTDLRWVMGLGKTTLHIDPSQQPNHESHVSHYVGRSTLVKEGEGTLVLDRPHDLVDRLDMVAGTVAIESNARLPRADGLVGTLPSDGCILHVDASASETIDKNELGEVTVWRDTSGSDNHFKTGAQGTQIGLAPIVRSNLYNGKAMVDFGGYGSKTFLDLTTPITTARTVLIVMDGRFGGGHVLTDSSASDYHRGNIASGNLMLSGYEIGASFGKKAGEAWIDLNTADSNRESLPAVPEVVTFTGRDKARKFGRIGQDRGNADRSGGLAVGEVVAYNRILSNEELAAAIKYLRAKWIEGELPTIRQLAAAGRAMIDARTDITVDTLSGDGVLVAKGGTITVNGVTDFKGALASVGGTWNILHNKGPAPQVNPVEDGLLAHFDFSNADNITTNGEGRITVIRSENDESLVATAPSGKEPLLSTGDKTVSGKTVLGSDTMYQPRGVVMSTSFTNVHTAISIVCPSKEQNGTISGGQLYGSTKINQAFQRGIGSYLNPILNAPTSTIGQPMVNVVDAWRNGVRIIADAEGFKNEFQTITTIWPTRMCLDELGIRAESSDGGGGLLYGEVLLWDRCLSDDERKSVEAYLQAKWLGNAVHGYSIEGKPDVPGLDTNAGPAAFAVPAETTTSVGFVLGSGGIVKTGAGELDIQGSLSEMTGDIVIEEGSVRYTVAKIDAATLPVTEGLLAHFDAASNVTTNDNGVVTEWQSKEGDATYGSYSATRCFTPETRAKTTDYPKLISNATYGLPCVDFGPFGDVGNGLWFSTNDYSANIIKDSSDSYPTIPDCKSVFLAFNSEKGGGFILGNASGSNFHRGTAKAQLGDSLFGTSVTDGDFKGAYLDTVSVAKLQTNVLNGAWQMMEVYKSANAGVAGFAFDRFQRLGTRTGGNKIGEAIFFNRILTDEEKVKMRMYLFNRWYHRSAPGSGTAESMCEYGCQAGTLKVASGALLDLNGYQQTVTNLVCGIGGSITGGDILVTQQLTAYTGNPLTVLGKVSFADGCVVSAPEVKTPGLWKVLSANAIEGLSSQVLGKIEVKGRPCPVRLQVVDDKDVYLIVSDPGFIVIVR